MLRGTSSQLFTTKLVDLKGLKKWNTEKLSQIDRNASQKAVFEKYFSSEDHP